MKTLRIAVVGFIGVMAGFTVQGCTAKQPVPECDVLQAAGGFGLAPFYVQLRETSRSGACNADEGYHHIYVGMERFHPPFTQDFSVAIRSSILVDMTEGIAPAGIGGDTLRSDPADPNGDNINVIAKMSQFPTNGICSLTDYKGGTQNFQDEGAGYPAVSLKTDWTSFNLYSTSRVPGTGWDAKLKYTRDSSCTIDYDAKAFWPLVGCETDADCDPFEDPDAGRYFGSGINPNFKPKCELVDLSNDHYAVDYWFGHQPSGICTPSVDLATLK
jgi:hypothetical protein